ncbi:MAG TPA: histidine phosphatase family protein [Acidimicrobiia bacterium]|nr:histidine phosphatase family protein [Acidimicrobiia bacterium]
MPGLILFRHGKSDWDADYPGGDAARPLARRGQKAAKRMGKFLARAGQAPDAAITSPAVRTEDTLRLAMEGGGWTCPVRVAATLYHGGLPGLLAEVRKEPATTDVLLAVGHEPTWSEAVSALIGGGQVGLPTAAMARIDFDVDGWDEVAPRRGVLGWIVVPRLLAGSGERRQSSRSG